MHDWSLCLQSNDIQFVYDMFCIMFVCSFLRVSRLSMSLLAPETLIMLLQ